MQLAFISPTLEEADFLFAREHGFAGVEVNMHIPLGAPTEGEQLVRMEQRSHDIAALAARYDVPVCGVGVWHLNVIDPARARQSLQYYERVVKFANAIGCKVVYHGSGSIRGATNDTMTSQYRHAAERIMELSATYNVRPCLYSAKIVNFAWDPSTWDDLFGSLPGMGLKYDPSHLFEEFAASSTYYEALQRFATKFPGRIYHVHLKDVLRVPGGKVTEDVPPGFGHVEWRTIFGILYSCGYDGFVSLEPRGRWLLNENSRKHALLLGKRYFGSLLL